MVWVKSGYGKRRYTKKYYKRSSPLKKKNIYKNTTAKSQATQIYRLNRKINSVYKNIAPEMIIKECGLINKRFDDGVLHAESPLQEWHYQHYLYEEKLLGATSEAPPKGPGCGYEIKGKMLRCRNITLRGTFQICNNYNSYGEGRPCYLKIIICRCKESNQGRFPGQITKPYITGQNDMGLINGSLVEGISAGLQFVKTLVLKIDKDEPAKNFKIDIKNPGVYREGPYTGNAKPCFKNEYIVYYQYLCPYLLLNGGDQGPLGPFCSLQSSVKFAFTDD